MRKSHRGAALPTAILFIALFTVFSFGIAYFVMEGVIINQLDASQDTIELIFLEAHNNFKAMTDPTADLASLSLSDRFDWAKHHKDDTNIYALTAYDKGTTNLKFYSIYDFTNENKKTLAYQTSNFYITSETVENKTTYYLGGIVKYLEVTENA